MADTPTIRIAAYIAERKVKIAKLARETNIPEGKLRRSLKRQERSLRAGGASGNMQVFKNRPMGFLESR